MICNILEFLREYFKNSPAKIKNAFDSSFVSFVKIIISICFFWFVISLIYFKPIPLFDLIKDTLENQIKENSRVYKYLKKEESLIDTKNNEKGINYTEYYNTKGLEGIELPIYLKLGGSYLKEIEKYNLSENNTKLLKKYVQDLNSFHSKMLLELFKDEYYACNSLFKIVELNQCTFKFIFEDSNFKNEMIYEETILLNLKKIVNLILIYFNKFDKSNKIYNENLSSFYSVA